MKSKNEQEIRMTGSAESISREVCGIVKGFIEASSHESDIPQEIAELLFLEQIREFLREHRQGGDENDKN